MIGVDDVMACRPCNRYPRERVVELLGAPWRRVTGRWIAGLREVPGDDRIWILAALTSPSYRRVAAALMVYRVARDVDAWRPVRDAMVYTILAAATGGRLPDPPDGPWRGAVQAIFADDIDADGVLLACRTAISMIPNDPGGCSSLKERRVQLGILGMYVDDPEAAAAGAVAFIGGPTPI